MNTTDFKIIVAGIVATLILFGAGWLGHGWYDHRYSMHNVRRVKATGYRLTSPLLDVELPEGLAVNKDIGSFKNKVVDLIAEETAAKKVVAVSVYYRDLVDGPWFGIDEDKEFNPASMMKIPVMVAWLKRAEKNPLLLKQKLLFKENVDMSAIQTFKPRYTLVKGESYTIETLLEYMMMYSDNNATAVLYKNLSHNELDAVLASMDVENHANDTTNSISVHGFSGFFRILYNASFLNRDMSEKALQLLSREDFPQGIAAGVPKGTIVAAKFGEVDGVRDGGDMQLHEFGIVYHPKGHYILGIMTEGKNYTLQAEVIRNISALIYQEVATGVPINE